MIFLGIDWSEIHHDACLVDVDGHLLAKGRVPDGVEGVAKLHEMVAAHAEDPAQVVVGIELDRGLLVGALVAAGYAVHAINPLSVDRYRDRHRTSGPSRIRATPKCLRTSCGPTGTCTDRWQETPSSRRRSKCWPGLTRA